MPARFVPSRLAWRRLVAGVVLVAGMGTLIGLLGTAPAGASPRVAGECTQATLSQQETINQLHEVRLSIDRTLRLLDSGQRAAAFAEAKTGYLDCFEALEAPLDIVAGQDFRFSVEDIFARVRALIQTDDASSGEIRAYIVELRGLIDDAERQLTTKGVGAPAIAFGQSFTLLLREGLEAVLLLAVLLAYLESSEHARHRRPILYGVGLAILATVVTFFLVDALFAVLPFGREVLEAVVGILAVAMLFYVSFWLLARLDQRRRMEFLQARVWKAASVGSAASLAFVGFTAVYREGFETVLFYQALFSYGEGLQAWILAGMATAAAVLAVVGWLVLKMGRQLPVKRFLQVALVVVMATSVAVIGNAMRALQEAAIINLHFLNSWPSLPIYLAQATGYYPTLPSVVAQGTLIVVYVAGAIATVFVKRRHAAVTPRPATPAVVGEPVSV